MRSFAITVGAGLETVCSHCGEKNRRGATFCRICSQTINQTATFATAAAPSVPTPDSYVPRHLAERILASRQTVEGERKQVTVPFADIRGSTSLLEGPGRSAEAHRSGAACNDGVGPSL